jgi:hypothetical protein
MFHDPGHIEILSLICPLGRRQKTLPSDGMGFGFVCKAHPPVHIEMNKVDVTPQSGPKTSKMVELCFASAPKIKTGSETAPCPNLDVRIHL